MQTRLFVRPEIFGGIDDHRSHAGASTCLVCGKPDIGQKYFAIVPRAMALHDGAESTAFVPSRGEIEQRREIAVNRRAFKTPCGDGEELAGRFVSQKKVSF